MFAYRRASGKWPRFIALKTLSLLLFTMRRALFLFSLSFANCAFAQDTLPGFKIINANNNIIISWINPYTKPVMDIKIQRSFDSLKNYATIGAVLSPSNFENGYTDNKPPYNKMYYRMFIAFEDGSYIITPTRRPVKLPPPPPLPQKEPLLHPVPEEVKPEKEKDKLTSLPVPSKDQNTSDSITITLKRLPWQADPLIDSSETNFGELKIPGKPAITYPSKQIFINNNHLVVIHLPDAVIKNYSAKFFDEKGKKVFEISGLKEEYLMLEKANFMHSGWFTFELYRNGELVEKNKLFIPKDNKSNFNNSLRKPGN